MAERQMGHVYFIQAECREKVVKIGWTKNSVRDRLSHLRVGSPVPLKGIGVIPGTLGLEYEIQVRFHEACSHGEWYKPVPELLAYIRENAQRWPKAYACRHKNDPEQYRLLLIVESADRDHRHAACDLCGSKIPKRMRCHVYTAGIKYPKKMACRDCAGARAGIPLLELVIPRA